MFRIDEDITIARTPPSRLYTDPSLFDSVIDRVFRRTWQFAARVSGGANLVPFTLFGDPLLIVRREGGVGCLSNVCTHRGAILVGDACSADGIRCGYHGRRFGLDGRFLSMPEFEGVRDFPAPGDDLARLECGTFGDLAFVSAGPAAPFDDFFAEARAAADGLWSGPLEYSGEREYSIAANWALYCENYLEGFHIPYVHRGLNRVLEYDSYVTETYRFSSLQKALAKPGENAFSDGTAALYFFVFPNVMLNFYPWGLSVNVVEPVAVERTRIRYLTYVAVPELAGDGAGGDLHTVELEDQAVVESVQRGVASRFYDRGRYSPSRETGTHHFHRLIAEFLQ